MNVQQVIAELQKFPPEWPVHVVPRCVTFCTELGEHEIEFDEMDSAEADDVVLRGGHILVVGGK